MRQRSKLVQVTDSTTRLATPKFARGDRVGTHELTEGTILEVSSIAPPYEHGVTGTLMPSEVWYEIRRDDGTTGIFSELHLTLIQRA